MAKRNLSNFIELKRGNQALAKLYLCYYQKMSSEDFLDFVCEEMRGYNEMTERVEIFMALCTDMSYTNYTPEVIGELVDKNKERDLVNFCRDILEEYQTTDEIIEYLKEKAIQL